MRTAIIRHPACRKHNMGQDHPECPARLDAINDRLLASGLDLSLSHLHAPKADKNDFLRVHSLDLVERVLNSIPEQGLSDLDGDTALCPHSLAAIERAVGAGMMAVDEVLAGTLDAAFCAVRPPGHHASGDNSAGFCVFNNLAIAADYAIAKGIERIAVLDIDVHHGDGTQAILRDYPQVLFCSLFQYPLYPDPEIENAERLVHSPLPRASNGDDFRQLVNQQWLPKLEKFKPQLILVSAGFDAHLEDDMASLNFVEQDYGWFSQTMSQWAADNQVKGVISFLEGGYNLSALGRSVAAYLQGSLAVEK